MNGLLAIVLFAAALAPAQQGAMEAPAASTGFPVEWPAGPGQDAQPAWARPGAIRFARWDGGRIETAKAFLSGWPGFNPPSPDFVESMTNWYTSRTIGLLAAARINTVWITFSNGFSIPSERAHMEQCRRYIDECHRRGIRVLAYQSISNLFWEDMFEHVPESRDWVRTGSDGKPTPYGAAAYARMGRTTRYMARISHPGWQEYLRKRVDLALDAGADGVFYDNNFNEALPETYQAIYRHGASRKRDFVLMGNFHENSYVLNRLTNALSTEDGLEPGVYAPDNVKDRLDRHRPALLDTGAGYLVNNIGLFRVYAALSQGWKPVMIEHGHREVGERFSNPIPAARQALAIAEAAACGGAFQVFSEGAFADGLWRGKPEAMEIWAAITRYHRFLEDNRALYENARPVSPVAVILDDRSEGVPLLDGLAARNVLFDVLYEYDLTASKLRPYKAAAVLARGMRERAARALQEYRGGGGLLIEKAGSLKAEALASSLKEAAGSAAPLLDAPAGVVYTVSSQPAAGRTLVHLLNYTGSAKTNIGVTVPGACGGASLLSPDPARESGFRAAPSGKSCRIEIPRLDTYSVLVLVRK